MNIKEFFPSAERRSGTRNRAEWMKLKRFSKALSRGFALFVLILLVIAPTVAACPYIVDLGDQVRFSLQETSAAYAYHTHPLDLVNSDLHRHSYQWGWGVGTNNWRFQFTTSELKKLDQRVNSESKVGHFTVFDNLNQNDDQQICGFGIIAYNAKVGTQPMGGLPSLQVPCRARQIALDHLAAGRTSYFGRAGEIFALAAFIILHEYETKFTTADPLPYGWNPNWYWSSRQILSVAGIRYQGTLPDFKIGWPSTVTEVARRQCFFVCWIAWQAVFPDNEVLLDAMEVKTTSVGASVLRLAETDLRRESGYSAYIPTGVRFESNWVNVYFEFAQYHSEFRFGG